MIIMSTGTILHGVTLWGYEIDYSTGLVTKLYITDSDNQLKTPNEPRVQTLEVYELKMRNDGKGVGIVDAYMPFCEITEIVPLKMYR